MNEAPAYDLLEKKLSRAASRAIADFSLIAEGDRILVAVSGGKDSYTMLHLLRALQRKAPVSFALRVVNVDQGHPGYPGHLLREYMAREGYDFTMIEEDTYSIVTEKIPAGKTYCSLCSRLRRGILYRVARELGCNKIALGHHRDDVLQTLLLNMIFAGQLAAMPPRLVADGGAVTVVRPLVYCAEDDIRAFSTLAGFPILPCDSAAHRRTCSARRWAGSSMASSATTRAPRTSCCRPCRTRGPRTCSTKASGGPSVFRLPARKRRALPRGRSRRSGWSVTERAGVAFAATARRFALGAAAQASLAGAYAWAVAVAPLAWAPAASAATIAGATIAFLALVLGVLGERWKKPWTRPVSLWSVVLASAFTWSTFPIGLGIARIDPVRGVTGMLAWALYALAYAGPAMEPLADASAAPARTRRSSSGESCLRATSRTSLPDCSWRSRSSSPDGRSRIRPERS